MSCERCNGEGEIVTKYYKATWNGPEEYVTEPCPNKCVECEKCGKYDDHIKDLGHQTFWCPDCLDNYDGPGDDYYSDFYGGGQPTQEERYREAAEQKRKLG